MLCVCECVCVREREREEREEGRMQQAMKNKSRTAFLLLRSSKMVEPFMGLLLLHSGTSADLAIRKLAVVGSKPTRCWLFLSLFFFFFSLFLPLCLAVSGVSMFRVPRRGATQQNIRLVAPLRRFIPLSVLTRTASVGHEATLLIARISQ